MPTYELFAAETYRERARSCFDEARRALEPIDAELMMKLGQAFAEIAAMAECGAAGMGARVYA
jgi:hypothetical protein